MQLRYLKTITLKSSTKTKQANGTYVSSYTIVQDYKVQMQELTDEISASIYGADVSKMLRISSPKQELEKYLSLKVNNTSDNISKYFIFDSSVIYKIVSVKKNWVDIERL